MNHGFSNNPALVAALALAAGMAAQIIARHLNVPTIAFLLASGVALGPDGVGWIEPQALGPALLELVHFAVAVILFEGALNLNLRRIRRLARPIRRLLTLGAATTGTGTALAARWLLGWSWSVAVLFGCLMMVTGPTVINPLLRRLKVERSVSTVLEAEGVFVDAIGAILAVVVMEIIADPVEASLGPLHLAGRLGVGAAFGLAGGSLITAFFRSPTLIPAGLENVTTLAFALALFQLANATLPESGIAAVIVAGLVVGNLRPHIVRELHEFKGQLTVLLIGLLFILLAADVRLASVQALGLPGAAVVGVLLFVVRPIAVFMSTHGSELSWRQRAFIAWIGPRGIVAAAVASVFAVELEQSGVDGGRALRALVFATIAASVAIAGLTGGPMARLLRLRRGERRGWVLLGAGSVAREMAATLVESGQEAVCIDANPNHCELAKKRGLRVLYGNGLSDSTLRRAEIDVRRGAVGLTRSDEMNYLFVDTARLHERELDLFVAQSDSDVGVTREMLETAGAHVLVGQTHDVDQWSRWLDRGEARREQWQLDASNEAAAHADGILRNSEDSERGLVLGLVVHRGDDAVPAGSEMELGPGDSVTFLVREARDEAAHRLLSARGFTPMGGTHRSNRAQASRPDRATPVAQLSAS